MMARIVRKAVDIDQTRREIRDTFRKWDIDPSEFEILWEEDEGEGRSRTRRPGARVRYLRAKVWQEVSCFTYGTRAANLRQCYLLLDRLRIAEQQGVQYVGLTHTTEVSVADKERAKKETLLEAYDILGVGPDDDIETVKGVFRAKAQRYHPDHAGGNAERFKRLNEAYEMVCESRRVKP